MIVLRSKIIENKIRHFRHIGTPIENELRIVLLIELVHGLFTSYC